LLQKITI